LIDAMSQRDINAVVSAIAVKGVDDRLATTSHEMTTLIGFNSGEDHLVEEGHAVIFEPVHRFAGAPCECTHWAWVDRVLIEKQIVAVEPIDVIVDAQLTLEPRLAPKDGTARETRRSSDGILRFGDKDATCASLMRCHRRREAGRTRADYYDVNISLCAIHLSPWE
jgi:hypothetical protein